MDRVQAAFEARDWAAMRAVYATDARIEDRRHLALASGDVEWWIADKQQVARVRPGARYERQLVGTYGDRLALERVLWTGEPEAGRFEVEYLWLTEVDEHGRITGAISFDPDDWGAATREACDRWLASDAAAAPVVRPVSEFFVAFSEHDRVRVRAVLADDLVVDDRRRAGLGRVDGADAYVESIAVLWNLAPDIQVDGRVGLALERHGLVSAGRDFGTLAEGGAFERPRVAVLIVAGGRITRFEMFDVEDADAALARFAELRPKTSP